MRPRTRRGAPRAAPPAGPRLLGRDAELAWLAGREGAARVVVTGPSGIGKTALVEGWLGGRPAARVVVTAGAGVSELARAIATACGAPDLGADASPAALAREAAARAPGPVFLDGAEAAPEAVAELLDLFARGGARLPVIVASRVRIPAPRGASLALGPLPLPAATELFVERAGVAGDDARARAARIARALDGVPLSIVLVAASLRVFDLATLEELVTARELSALGVGGAIEASLDAVPAPALELLARLAHFQGAFTVRRALTLGGSPLDLEELVDRSLVARAGSLEADARLSVLRPIREAVRARARAEGSVGEGAAARAWLRALAATAAPVDDDEARELAHGVSLALATGDAATAGALALRLAPFHLARGPFDRYAATLDRVLAAKATPLAGELHLARAKARGFAGDHAGEAADLERAIARGPASVKAQAQARLAFVFGRKGDLDRALTTARAAEKTLRAAERAPGAVPIATAGRVLKDVANVYAEAGSDVAYDYLLRARAALEEAGEVREVAFVELMLAGRYCDEGRTALARAHAERALAGFRVVGDARSPIWANTLLGVALEEERAFDDARARFEEARRLAAVVGDAHSEALVAGYAGGLALEAGRHEEAMTELARASQALERIGDLGASGYFAGALGVALGREGHGAASRAAITRARRLLPKKGRGARATAVGIFARIAAGEPPGPEVDLASRFEEVRFASRVATGGAREAAAPARALTVGPRLGFLELDGARVDLHAFPLLGRIAGALLERREAEPGAPVALDELLARAWPDERILPRAAKNRLYVAIARLRDKGLGAALQRKGSGYLLDPAIPVVRVT